MPFPLPYLAPAECSHIPAPHAGDPAAIEGYTEEKLYYETVDAEEPIVLIRV
jgi:hypothetical protein